MRIFGGPQLVVPRAGLRRHDRHYWHRSHMTWLYDEHLSRERARIRALPSVSVADRKRPTVTLYRVTPGSSFRLVDHHGRSHGVRFTAPCGLPWDLTVRVVNRQREDYHSMVSRMLKRAHRVAVREDRHTL